MTTKLLTFENRAHTEHSLKGIDARLEGLYCDLQRIQDEIDHLVNLREAAQWELANCSFPDDDQNTCPRCDGTGMAGHGGLLASEAECGHCNGTGESK